jgi:hypothetical protein
VLLFEGFRFHRAHFDGNFFLLTILKTIVEVENSNSPTINKINAFVFGDWPVRHNSFGCDDQALLERRFTKARDPFNVTDTA